MTAQYNHRESIGYWLTVTTQAYHRTLRDELAPYGITYRQMQVVGWLAIEGNGLDGGLLSGALSQAELASRMMIEPPTLVGILDRMERSGWITREGCPQDRRKKLIRLKPDAEPIWEKIIRCFKKVRAQATAGLSEQELKIMERALDVIRTNLGAIESALENSA